MTEYGPYSTSPAGTPACSRATSFTWYGPPPSSTGAYAPHRRQLIFRIERRRVRDSEEVVQPGARILHWLISGEGVGWRRAAPRIPPVENETAGIYGSSARLKALRVVSATRWNAAKVMTRSSADNPDRKPRREQRKPTAPRARKPSGVCACRQTSPSTASFARVRNHLRAGCVPTTVVHNDPLYL